MHKIIINLLLIITLLAISVHSYSVTNFTDGTSNGNLTYDAKDSYLLNINLPYWASVQIATINLKGYSGTTCFQEYANVSTACGGLDTGKYAVDYNSTTNPGTEYDGNYNTCNLPDGVFYINYTKPDAYGAIWVTSINSEQLNVTIPDSCFNANETKLILRNWANQPDGNGNWECFNNTKWITLRQQISRNICEESIYWLMNVFPSNITIKTNNQLTYHNNSNFSGIVNNINLNISSLQSCVNSVSSGNINCSINFTSESPGILQYSNLQIDYSEFDINNCSNSNNTILQIIGKDEETDGLVNTSLNINLYPTAGTTSIYNATYQLRGNSTYNFCSSKNNTNIRIDGIMEYGDGTTYTYRKYYLNNFSIDTNITSQVILYHLNNTKASEITFTVFDLLTGDRVSEAYIKTLRYYPGENAYRTVEIGKTDETGQSLGKMVLADVFYKFIIEKPAGQVKLDTDVLRILALTRSFGISFAVDYLDTWNKINNVATSVTCTKGTQTCRLTWSDSSNIVQNATLEVWRTNGLNNEMINSQTTSATSGTIAYTIIEDTLGNSYTAKGYIESNTGTSTYDAGIASIDYPDNPFFNDQESKIASLFPLLILIVVIIFTLIDFGVIGIVIGALIGLLIGALTHIMPLDPFYFISFIIMAIILIYKLSR